MRIVANERWANGPANYLAAMAYAAGYADAALDVMAERRGEWYLEAVYARCRVSAKRSARQAWGRWTGGIDMHDACVRAVREAVESFVGELEENLEQGIDKVPSIRVA